MFKYTTINYIYIYCIEYVLMEIPGCLGITFIFKSKKGVSLSISGIYFSKSTLFNICQHTKSQMVK